MKKILTSTLVAATLAVSVSAEFVTFEFDTMPYMAGQSTKTVSQAFTLGFKVNNTLRAGIMQETGTTQLTQGASNDNADYTASALNLEYFAYKNVVDAIVGLNIGTLNTQGAATTVPPASVLAPGAYMMTDIYAKANYSTSKNVFLNLKLGYRVLPISDTGTASALKDQNAPFLKIGVGVKF